MLGVLQFILKSLVARQKCRLSQSAIIKIIQKVMEYRHKIKKVTDEKDFPTQD